MLKRYQVLLGEWTEDYIKLIAERYDLSSSAVIRAHMGLGIIFIITTLHPEYKLNFGDKEFQELSKKAAEGKLDEAETHQVLSRTLFEARKALEFRLSKIKMHKKI
jgi:hypothetical protein